MLYKLPPHKKALFLYLINERMTQLEIARKMNVTVATVQRWQKLLRGLPKCLE